jgi:hypothetical protein
MATTNNAHRRALTFGIIGAGIVVAVIVGVLFVMPLVTAPPPLTPEQQRQEVLNTPNIGQPGQPIIEHQELRRDDPIFDRFMVVWEQCDTALDNRVEPDVIACRQALSDGIDRWCSISSEHYHDVKCREVNENASVFDLRLEANAAMRGLNQQ